MKKYLPIILLAVGLLVLVGAYFIVSRMRGGGDEETGEEVALMEIPLEKRPVTSLTPRSDGHWLDMKIEKLMVDGAETLDYELLYNLPDGRTQGVPGTLQLEGRDSLEAELLLGSESSGKFRYDEGVERGTLTLRFRNEKGKLIAKLSTEFHMQTATDMLTSSDAKLRVELSEESDNFFVVMQTFGYPGDAPGSIVWGPYGVFSSGEVDGGSIEGEGQLHHWTGSEWTTEIDGDSFDTGIFLGI